MEIDEKCVASEGSDSVEQKRPWFATHLQPTLIAPTKHATFDDEARKQLEDEGFCVISSVLTLDECVTALGLAWDYVEVLPRLSLHESCHDPSLSLPCSQPVLSKFP
jgi:hypothetical protein